MNSYEIKHFFNPKCTFVPSCNFVQDFSNLKLGSSKDSTSHGKQQHDYLCLSGIVVMDQSTVAGNLIS